MKYLSICSGIEAASVAWHPLGWEPLAFSEIEPFPRAVLQHHYPDVPLHGDFTVLKEQPWIVDADVLVGGTPCQAFSVAGLRKSLGDDRGNLSLEFIRLADSIDAAREAQGRDPSVIVWENVPGVLSVRDNAFGCFLAGLAGDVTPYDPPRGKWTDAGVVDGPQRAVAWRVLDAQYFGLAQRRRRVFVVASARDGFDPAAVLLEFEGMRRDTPPRRETGQIAPTIPARSLGGGGLGTDFDCDGGVIKAAWPADIAPTLRAMPHHRSHPNGGGQMAVAFHPTQDPISSTDGSTHALGCGSSGGQASIAVAFYANEGSQGSGNNVECAPTLKAHPKTSNLAAVAYPINTQIALRHQALGERTGMGIGDDTDPAFTLQAGHSHAVAVSLRGREGGGTAELGDEVQNCLRASSGGGDKPHVLAHMAVRRLTPTECERLQGFPDGYTMIPWKKKPTDECPDGPRYKALGNSMAVPVMAWIGKKIVAHLKGDA